MKRRNMFILYLAIFLIAEAIFFINMVAPRLSVILTSLLAAAFVSLVLGTIVLAVIYLIRKLNHNKA